jgi:hypothetical protein
MQITYNVSTAADSLHSLCIVTGWQKSRNLSIFKTEVSQRCPLLGSVMRKHIHGTGRAHKIGGTDGNNTV